MTRHVDHETHLCRFILLALCSVSLGTAVLAHAQDQDNANDACSVASMGGAYGFFRFGETSGGPLAAVGIVEFDGAGTSTARQTVRKNGVTTADLFNSPAPSSPYEVDPDCAGRILNPDGSAFAHFVVVNGGDEVFILSLSDANSVYGVMKKIRSHPKGKE